ncbi:Uncharacterised protein [Shigella sonnei]|nr:Uncharacterised protein [Shigella sonnei]CSF66675.1 Uncharacterised protein [Shigella sonnei]CSF83957.1 Uncharacterised protein [Shigella sonnei]
MLFQGGLFHSLCWSQWQTLDALPSVYLLPLVQGLPAVRAEFLQVQKVRLFLLYRCGELWSSQ